MKSICLKVYHGPQRTSLLFVPTGSPKMIVKNIICQRCHGFSQTPLANQTLSGRGEMGFDHSGAPGGKLHEASGRLQASVEPSHTPCLLSAGLLRAGPATVAEL